MSVATAAFLYRNRKVVIGSVLGLFAVMILLSSGGFLIQTPSSPGGGFGNSDIPPEVERWEPAVRQYAVEFGVEAFVPVMLALMTQESGGRGNDPMQSSEGAFNTKYCKQPNCIQDPMYSIWCGVQEFKAALQRANVTSPADMDGIKLVLQGYNFGPGFIDYVSRNGGKYTIDLAKAFSAMMAQKLGWGCSSWQESPYCYGDKDYVDHVWRYLSVSVGDIGGGSALGDDVFQRIMAEALKYQGWPYQWAGDNPTVGFDCSGLTSYVYRVAGGISLPRTAQEQYEATTRINEADLKPGDLIFFHTADYNYVTHVGIYIGSNKMYDSNNSGIGYSELNNYWKPKIVAYGRVK